MSESGAEQTAYFAPHRAAIRATTGDLDTVRP